MCRTRRTPIPPGFTVRFAPQMTAKPSLAKQPAVHGEALNSPRQFFGVFRYSKRALELLWSTSRKLSFFLAFVTVLAGALPSVVAWVGARIVDTVVIAMRAHSAGGDVDIMPVLGWVLMEALTLVIITAAHRGITLCQSLLKAKLSNSVNVMILEKALTLELTHFEDSEFYDKLTRARREASSRPLSLVMRTSGLFQNAISITSFSVLLAGFSPWAVVVLIFGGLPAFFAETKFSGDAFRLFKWRAPRIRAVQRGDAHERERETPGFAANREIAILRVEPIVDRLVTAEEQLAEVEQLDLLGVILARQRRLQIGLHARLGCAPLD
jgi:ABC-type multidrug transport system fused ATPase/permease subunit